MLAALPSYSNQQFSKGPMIALQCQVDILAESINSQTDWSYLQSTLDKTPTSTRYKYKVGKIAIVYSDLTETSKYCQGFEGWGIVRHVLNSTAMLAINGEVTEYYFHELHLLENPSPSLKEVCQHITRLWEIPNLPLSTQGFLKRLQQQLYFSPKDLCMLQALAKVLSKEIGRDVLSKEYQNNLENSALF